MTDSHDNTLPDHVIAAHNNYTQREALIRLNQPIDDILHEIQRELDKRPLEISREEYLTYDGLRRVEKFAPGTDEYKQRMDAYETLIKKHFNPDTDEGKANIARVAEAREEMLQNPKLRGGVENTGANFTLVGLNSDRYEIYKGKGIQDLTEKELAELPLDALELYLVERQIPVKGAVGAVGGLSQRMPAGVFYGLSKTAQKLLLAFADEGRPTQYNDILERLAAYKGVVHYKGHADYPDGILKAYKDAKDKVAAKEEGAEATLHNIRETIYGFIGAENNDLAKAIKELNDAGVYQYRGKPVDVLDGIGNPAMHEPPGMEFLRGGMDDVVIDARTGEPHITTDIDLITYNNRVREGHEEVGNIGIDLAKIHAQGRVEEVNMTGVRDDDYVIRIKATVRDKQGNPIGTPLMSGTDYAVSPKVAAVFLSGKERDAVRAKKMQSSDEIVGFKAYTPAQAIARSVFAPKDGGYQYAHEAYAAMAVIKRWAGGDLSKLNAISQQVQAAINDHAQQMGIPPIRFSFSKLAAAKKISPEQLAENLGLNEGTLQHILEAEKKLELYDPQLTVKQVDVNRQAAKDLSLTGISVVLGDLVGGSVVGTPTNRPAKDRAVLVFVDPYHKQTDPQNPELKEALAEYRSFVARAPKLPPHNPDSRLWSDIKDARHHFMTNPWISSPNKDGMRVIVVPAKNRAEGLDASVTTAMKIAQHHGVRHVDMVLRDDVETSSAWAYSIAEGLAKYRGSENGKGATTATVAFPLHDMRGDLPAHESPEKAFDAFAKSFEDGVRLSIAPRVNVHCGHEKAGVALDYAAYHLKPEQRAILVPVYPDGSMGGAIAAGLNASDNSAGAERRELDAYVKTLDVKAGYTRPTMNVGDVFVAKQQEGRPHVVFAAVKGDSIRPEDISKTLQSVLGQAQEKGIKHIDMPMLYCGNIAVNDRGEKLRAPKAVNAVADALASHYQNPSVEGHRHVTTTIMVEDDDPQRPHIVSRALVDALKDRDPKGKLNLVGSEVEFGNGSWADRAEASKAAAGTNQRG